MDAARVRVATCHDRAQAIAIREELEASGIDAVVSGESHAPPGLEGLATGFQSFDVWVSEADGERAAELLGGEDPEEDGGDDGGDGDDHGHDSLMAIDAERGLERRKRTGVAILLSCAITFGTGHMYTGAWMRGITLAAIEVVGFGQLGTNPALAAVLVGLAIVCDAVGSTMRVIAATAGNPTTGQLPPARVIDR